MFKNKKPVVAIDGTAGSGKGTLAKNLSKIIDFDPVSYTHLTLPTKA